MATLRKPKTEEQRQKHILYMRKYMAERKIRKRAERAARVREAFCSIPIDEWRAFNSSMGDANV